MELARSNLVASGAPTAFWTYAVAHSVDILNRTTGPPQSSVSSYECLTDVKPRIMPILPFGCRAFAVKPREAYSKTRIEPRAWVGINLGRSLSTPGAYSIYVPSIPRIVLTSEVYDENVFPWKPSPAPNSPVAVAAVDTGQDQPPGIPIASSAPRVTPHADRSTTQLPDAPRPAHASKTVLLLFSGPFRRPDGIAAFLKQA
eukprot:859813-Pleurochrysis_carterae.AAC.1